MNKFHPWFLLLLICQSGSKDLGKGPKWRPRWCLKNHPTLQQTHVGGFQFGMLSPRDLNRHPCGGINTRNRPWSSPLARIEIKTLKIKILNTSLSSLDKQFELF
jgi:hypothetical protein